MPKISLAGFKDPVRRPRYIIWTGAVVIFLAAFVITALGITSTYWFCAEVCHKVQDDTITAYNNSTHSEISCMACHMPVGADPVTFLFHKAQALGELYLTATDNFEIPLNGGSHLAQDAHHMGSEQCTQCHNLENREVTPSRGVLIDHEVHSENSVHCTLCHNRVAHNEEGIEFVNVDPESGELNIGHPDFMTMTACFRCHGFEEGAEAPGACSACHPSDFELKPESHFAADFYPEGHADMALEEIERVEAARAAGEHGEEGAEEGAESEEGTESEEATAAPEGDEESSLLGVSEAHATEAEEGDREWELVAVEEVNYCSTCHRESFCTDCHGMEMPHPQEFIEEEHPEVVQTMADKCEFCHHQSETFFCDSCHHGTAVEWEFDPAIAWQTQHASTVVANGTQGCLERCHEVQFCYDCHTQLQPVPASHSAADWLRKPVDELGVHAANFQSQPTSCEICHGADMPNDNSFCRGCHVLEMPHPQEFKEFHAATGKENPAVCSNCHTFVELCSDCHHEGAVDGTPWRQVHGGVVNESGAAGCFEQCHEDRAFCVNCHTSLNVVPASHNQEGWTRRPSLSTAALHPAAYDGNAESCTYCHGEGGPEAAFCMGCHGLPMPHPADYGAEGAGNGGQHAEGFADQSLDRAACDTCHSGTFCNRCHHGYTAAQPWVNAHPATVRESGADACFECHEETYCSFCHVRRAQEFIQ